MKKFLKFGVLTSMLIALCVGLSSCKKDGNDNDKDKNKNTSIVGVWTYVNITLEVEHPEQSMVDFVRSMVAVTDLFMKGTKYEFKTDGKCYVTAFGQTEELGTYTWNGTDGILTSKDEDGEITIEKLKINNGILSVISDELDEDAIAQGFTKSLISMNFKK
ncbi:MAG: hypothetical protein FWC39_00040 [Bacteroidetes bacterium]|nr:hypothetical protein [Bacteroidota bacterium]